jgi:hypothetical protein
MSVDIRIKHNEDFILDFILQDENGDPVEDLVGATAEMQIKSTTLSSTPLVTTAGVISPSEGTVQFTVPDTTMMSLLADGDMRRSLVYGTRITYSDEVDEEPVSGRIQLYRGVVG